MYADIMGVFLIKILFFCLLCFFVNVSVADFHCREYAYKQTKDWSCAHLKRRSDINMSATQTVLLLNSDSRKLLDEQLQSAADDIENELYIAAEQAYRAILQKNPAYLPAWMALANFYSTINRDKDALQICYQAQEKRPENAELLFQTGLLQVRLRLFSLALRSLAKAAVKAPYNSHYNYVYAIALNSTQRPYKALDVLQQMYKRDRQDTEVLTALMNINYDLNHLETALMFAHKLLLIAPDNDSARDFVLEFSH